MSHQRRTSDESIESSRRQPMHPQGTAQLMPNRTPPIHSRQHSLHHIDTPPQQFQVPMVPGHGSPQPATGPLRGGVLQPPMHGVQDGMGLGIGMSTPQPYGVNYNPYGHQQVYITGQVYHPSVKLICRKTLHGDHRQRTHLINILINLKIPTKHPHPFNINSPRNQSNFPRNLKSPKSNPKAA